MHYELVKREQFYEAVRQITYREDDIKEAAEFGCRSIEICYRKAIHTFAKYFVVYDDSNVPVVTVMLQRDGHIIFFISEIVISPITLIRTLKALADSTVNCCGPIVTKTAYWYTEAQRLNRIIGFKTFEKRNYYAFYYYEG